MPVPSCSSCAAAVDHCHGTLVVHTGRFTECTEADCLDPDRYRHTFTIDCGDLAGGCSCDPSRSVGWAG